MVWELGAASFYKRLYDRAISENKYKKAQIFLLNHKEEKSHAGVLKALIDLDEVNSYGISVNAKPTSIKQVNEALTSNHSHGLRKKYPIFTIILGKGNLIQAPWFIITVKLMVGELGFGLLYGGLASIAPEELSGTFDALRRSELTQVQRMLSTFSGQK